MSAEPQCVTGNAFTLLMRALFRHREHVVEHAGIRFTLSARGSAPCAHVESFSASLHVRADGVLFQVTCGAAQNTVLVTPRRTINMSLIPDGPVIVDVGSSVSHTMAAILDVCATDLTTMQERPGIALRPEFGPLDSMAATVVRMREIAEQMH